MKEPQWDDCKGYSSQHTYRRREPLKSFRQLEPGMSFTSYYKGTAAEIRVIRNNNKNIEGQILKFETGLDVHDDLVIGDNVIVPFDKACHLNQDIQHNK